MTKARSAKNNLQDKRIGRIKSVWLLLCAVIFIATVEVLAYLSGTEQRLNDSTALRLALQVVGVVSYVAIEYLVYKLAVKTWRLSTKHATAILCALTLAFLGLLAFGPSLAYMLAVCILTAGWVLAVSLSRK